MRAINTLLDYEKTEFEISYSKWLMEVFTEPSEGELDEMERDLNRSLAEENRIITLKPANNQYYQPLQGV